MNWLESIYCYSQNERIKQGKSISYNSQNGNLMLTFCLLMWICGTLFLIIMTVPIVNDFMSTLNPVKLIGEIVVAILIALIYPIIVKTIGTQDNFERITESYLKMSSTEQRQTVRKGAAFFSLSLIYFPFVLLIIWIFG